MKEEHIKQMLLALDAGQKKQLDILGEAFIMALLGQVVLQHLSENLSPQSKKAIKKDMLAVIDPLLIQLESIEPKMNNWPEKIQKHLENW